MSIGSTIGLDHATTTLIVLLLLDAYIPTFPIFFLTQNFMGMRHIRNIDVIFHNIDMTYCNLLDISSLIIYIFQIFRKKQLNYKEDFLAG